MDPVTLTSNEGDCGSGWFENEKLKMTRRKWI